MSRPQERDLLVVGAGPYGLAVAAMAKARGLDPLLVGRPMEFWQRAMPAGMLLRSGSDWHLDPLERFTYQAFASQSGWQDEGPISLGRFLTYARAFAAHYDLRPEADRVLALTRDGEGYSALLDGQREVTARAVAVCAGVGPFPNLSHWLAGQSGVRHTVDVAELSVVKGRAILIIGGRQSAFEWAALAAEAGASAVHVVHRHPTPAFIASDWSWVDAMLDQVEGHPGWFFRLTAQEKADVTRRFWEEGRLRLEPWLAPRLERPEVIVWPEREVVDRDGSRLSLSDGSVVEAEQVILATGYRINLEALSYLDASLRHAIRCDEGFPVLDPGFQSSLPGLYFTSFPSTRSHGPFFGFIRGCPPTARMLVDSVLRH